LSKDQKKKRKLLRPRTRLRSNRASKRQLHRQNRVGVPVADAIAAAVERADVVLRGARADKVRLRRRAAGHLRRNVRIERLLLRRRGRRRAAREGPYVAAGWGRVLLGGGRRARIGRVLVGGITLLLRLLSVTRTAWRWWVCLGGRALGRRRGVVLLLGSGRRGVLRVRLV
jgi:hypothetical protein